MQLKFGLKVQQRMQPLISQQTQIQQPRNQIRLVTLLTMKKKEYYFERIHPRILYTIHLS